MQWTWRYEKADGTVVSSLPDTVLSGGFPSQSEAESWIGESWRDLLDAGIEQVTLLEGDRVVYGPMGLQEA